MHPAPKPGRHSIADASEIAAYGQGFDTAFAALPSDPKAEPAAYISGWQAGLLALIEGTLPASPVSMPPPIPAPSPAPVPAAPARPANMLPNSQSMQDEGWRSFSNAETAPATLPGPYEEAVVMRHRLTVTTQAPDYAIYGCPVVEGIASGNVYTISAWVWIPAAFRGTDIALCGAGYPAPHAQRPDFDRRDVWQRIYCPVEIPPSNQGLFPVLTVTGMAGDEIFTTAWKVEPGHVPTRYRASKPSEAGLGYLCNTAGLNHQALALFGLFLTALETRTPLRLPDMAVFGNGQEARQRVELGQVYDLAPLREFAALHGIELLPGPARGKSEAPDYYLKGASHIDAAQRSHTLRPDAFATDFFRRLVPALRQSSLLSRLRDEVFTQSGIRIAAQFRIENDWTEFAAHHPQPEDDGVVPFQAIVAKIRASLPEWQNGVYVACDEAGLPVDKETMRSTALRQYGLELFWKSDFLDRDELAGLSYLDLSLLDFEVASQAPIFVGMSRSSFSSMATFTRFAVTSQPVTSHYIYNLPGPTLGRRTDNGALRAAAEVVA